MQIQSPPGLGSVFIPHDGDSIRVDPGETVEVPDDIGKGLLNQGWLSPDGPRRTVADVLEWVDEDPERAAAALAEEQAKGDAARSSLVARLESITNKETD